VTREITDSIDAILEAAAEEREACAKIVETLIPDPLPHTFASEPDWANYPKKLAAAIRAREGK
jgi:hypothetical protein